MDTYDHVKKDLQKISQAEKTKHRISNRIGIIALACFVSVVSIDRIISWTTPVEEEEQETKVEATQEARSHHFNLLNLTYRIHT